MLALRNFVPRRVPAIQIAAAVLALFGVPSAVMSGSPSADAEANAPVRLNVLWRVPRATAGRIDHLTTSDPVERDRVGEPGSADVVAYVPGVPVDGTTPLYRFVSTTDGAHRDAPLAGEGAPPAGYRREGVVGYPWTTPDARATLPGLTPLLQARRGGDYALLRAGETLPGYSPMRASPPMYGYRRYGRVDTAFATLSAGGVTIRSNLVAGCSLWSWRWHGIEFVNVHDLGRLIQADAGFGYHGVGVLPTEAGSAYSGRPLGPATTQSAPCVSATAVDTTGPAPTQRTRAVPLEWSPAALGGGLSHPVAWPRMLIGKDVTLNYAGLGAVARYTTVVSVPETPAGQTGVEIPSVYLNGDLQELTLYDAAADTSTTLTVRCDQMYGINPNSGYGGIIAASPDGSRAFGFYGSSVEHGGSVTRFGAGFGYARFDCRGVGTGALDNPTVKLRALNKERWIAGENRFTTYLVSGTKADVRRLMRRLYQLGAR